MEFDCWQADALNLSTPQPLNCFCTSALSVLPSVRPATFACNAFITAPICAFDVAPTSAIVSRTTLANSSPVIACGKYAFKIDSSSFSLLASSARPPFSQLAEMQAWQIYETAENISAGRTGRRPMFQYSPGQLLPHRVAALQSAGIRAAGSSPSPLHQRTTSGVPV